MSETDGTDHTLAGPDDADSTAAAPPTHAEESDPSADSREGLAGDLGVSSERRGPARGVDEEVTYGATATHPDTEDTGSADDVPPEQSASDDRPEVHPDSPGPHVSDPDSNPGRGI